MELASAKMALAALVGASVATARDCASAELPCDF